MNIQVTPFQSLRYILAGQKKEILNYNVLRLDAVGYPMSQLGSCDLMFDREQSCPTSSISHWIKRGPCMSFNYEGQGWRFGWMINLRSFEIPVCLMDGAQVDETRSAIRIQYPDEFQYPLRHWLLLFFIIWFIVSLLCVLSYQLCQPEIGTSLDETAQVRYMQHMMQE